MIDHLTWEHKIGSAHRRKIVLRYQAFMDIAKKSVIELIGYTSYVIRAFLLSYR